MESQAIIHLAGGVAEAKLACGRLPDTGRDLCSQPTLSRLENSPRLRDVILDLHLGRRIDDSYPGEPAIRHARH